MVLYGAAQVRNRTPGLSADTFDVDSQTRAGASTTTPTTAAAVLRALATRHGAVLYQVPSTHLAGAVCAVEAWMESLAAPSLESTSRYGTAAADTLALALVLAANGVEPSGRSGIDCAPYEPFAALLTRLTGWLVEWFSDPLDRATAATLAAACLTAGPDDRLASVGELLSSWAEELTPGC